MWFVIKCIIISIVAIIAMHYGIQYLKDTFTIKRIKYTSSEIEKYKRVLQEISANGSSAINVNTLADLQLQISDSPHKDSFFTESTKSELMEDLDNFLSETVEEQYIDTLTQNNTQNNINISLENI